VEKITSRKVVVLSNSEQDSLRLWKRRFIEEEIHDYRTHDIEKKIEKQLQRFIDFFEDRYGHDRISSVVKRDVKAWLDYLYEKGKDGKCKGFAAATVNNHKAHLSLFMRWLHLKVPLLLPEDPTKDRGLKDILLPAPEPKALTYEQYLSLKNICDRLERFHLLKGRKWKGNQTVLRKNARPKRDRAIVFTLISTGIRREMLINIDLHQLQPNNPDELRKARRAKIIRIRGKGRTEQTKYLSYDARMAIADYLEFERPLDVDHQSAALFLATVNVPDRRMGGRLSVRTINQILEQIGKWHDAEQNNPDRKISPLTPHKLRHTFGYMLSDETNGNIQRLREELGHRNDRYINVYTNPPEEYRASDIENF